jgi:FMN phosphatase YigB (HAD superfamily)
MAPKYDAVIFDLGGVLIDWDRATARGVPANQLHVCMNSTIWHDLERGKLSLETACQVRVLFCLSAKLAVLDLTIPQALSKLICTDAKTIEDALLAAQTSLTCDARAIDLVKRLREAEPNVKLYVLSNMAKVGPFVVDVDGVECCTNRGRRSTTK